MTDAEHRDLDAEIHRRVFGFTDLCRLSVQDCEDVPHYSTNMNAAWLVVEKHATAGVVAVVRDPRTGQWGCRFGRTADVGHATAPEAVCRAALKALAESPATV